MFPPQTVKWQNERITRRSDSTHTMWGMAAQRMPPPFCFYTVINESLQVLINKNVMEETMLWSDSINNGGDFSCSYHNLHHTQKEESSLTQIFTKLSSNHSQRHTVAHKLTHHLLTRTLLFCALMLSQPQPLPSCTIPCRNRWTESSPEPGKH